MEPLSDAERAAEPRPKRRTASISPTQRTLAWCREHGYVAAVTEHWNPFAKIRQDLFDCIDVIALTPEGIVGIQTTSGSNHTARKTKALGSPKMGAWCASGGRFWIMSWIGTVPRIETVFVPVHRHISTARPD
jgi:hypothetical protein